MVDVELCFLLDDGTASTSTTYDVWSSIIIVTKFQHLTVFFSKEGRPKF